MKKLALAAALLAGGTLGLQQASFAHGGQYLGPGDTVPPGGGGGGGGAGPAPPGPGGPSAPTSAGGVSGGPGRPGAAPAGGGAPGTGTGGASADLTAWTFWWEFNKSPFLNLKAHIHDVGAKTGTEGHYLGRRQKRQSRDTLRPTETQILDVVVPALVRALETETNNDVVTGCLIALAKIGDERTEGGESAFEQLIAARLDDPVQEIRETAAVALGILANDRSVPTLVSLMKDTPEGRALVASPEVNYRTRSFAAYGLAMIGYRTASEDTRKEIVKHLREMLETDDTKSRDLAVACVVSLGLVPLDTIEPASAPGEGEALAPETCRTAQLDYLLRYLDDEERHDLVRAHAPTALARLLADFPTATRELYRRTVAESLLARLRKSSKAPKEIQQSCVLALGLLGDADDDALDREIRAALAEVPKNVSDQQTRNYALIAMAKIGGTPGPRGAGDEEGIAEAAKFLLGQLSKSSSQSVQSWAGVAIGVLTRSLNENGLGSAHVAEMTSALRSVLRDEKSAGPIGALAIGAGIARDLEAAEILLQQLTTQKDTEARGYVAVGLGLMNAREAIAPIQKVVRESKYQPDLLKQAAIGLGLLGDKELVGDLVRMLADAKSLATQASIAAALGFIGDQHSIDPLVRMLENEELTGASRGFAAVALGIVADKEPLPWNSKVAVDLNYLAATQTLNDLEGTGILNIL